MGFSRQEYWSGLLFPSPGIVPTQGSNPGLLHCRQALDCLSRQGSQYPSQAATILRTGSEETGTNCPWNWRPHLKQSRWHWSEHWWPTSGWPSELTAKFLLGPLPPILKSSARWLVGVESAFGRKLPSQLQALEIKRTLLSTNCLVSFGASSSWAHFSEQILAPRWGCALAMSGWGREYQMELPPWWCPWEAGRDRSSWLAGPEGGFGGSSQQLPKPFIWGILPVSSLLGTECQPPLFLGQTGRRLWTRWRAPRSSKSTGVHPANFSWGRSAIWAFLPVGSDVCLQLRTLYKHFMTLYEHFIVIWVSLLVVSDVYLTWTPFLLGIACLGLHILWGFVTVLSSDLWMCILFVWLVFLLPSAKWEQYMARVLFRLEKIL